MDMKKSDYLAYVTLILIASITTSIGLYIGNKIKKSEDMIQKQQETKTEEQLPEILPSQFPDFDAVKGKNPDPKIKNVTVSSDCSPDNGCVNDKPATVDFDGIKKDYLVKGQFSRAYFFIDALVDYNRPLTSWDDVYFSMNNKGGHIIPDGNQLPVPAGNTSKYLYNFNSVSYFPTIRDKEQNINKQNNTSFFETLRDNNKLNIHASISSNRPGRVIKEALIYYECFEGSDCSVEEIN